MIVISGKSVCEGIAFGKIFVYKKKEQTVCKKPVKNTEQELARFYSAKEEAAEQLKLLYVKALEQVSEAEAMIFNVHRMMLEDTDYNDSILNIIKIQRVNAQWAVSKSAKMFANLFSATENEYMKERAADIKDISERLINILNGEDYEIGDLKYPGIIFADDLTPSETIRFGRGNILSIVAKQGSSNSHAAILARAMNIPTLVSTNIELLEEYSEKMAVVDGFDGKVYIDPDERLLTEMVRKQEEFCERKKMLQELKGKENVTLDGRSIQICANINSPADIPAAIENDAGGIGLFRSEYLYLARNDFPGEEEQFKVYKDIVSKMGSKKVIIRTLDIGADKQAEYFGIGEEENPAMGYRAIRFCLDRTEVFKTQLRAIYRAAAYGAVSVIFPMITSVEEIIRIKSLIEEVKAELKSENIPYSEVRLGIMIETPAAVMISDELAKEADFFSIGTNDLTQYTLAIDRRNQKLDSIYNPHHRAIIRMIEITVNNAHAAGIQVSVCGELASDLSITETLLKIGVDELSVSPAYILALRKRVRELQIK